MFTSASSSSSASWVSYNDDNVFSGSRHGLRTSTDAKDTYWPEPDMELISEILEQISRNPQAQEARKILMQQYTTCGWLEAAEEQAREILRAQPRDAEAAECLDLLRKTGHTAESSDFKGKSKSTHNIVTERDGLQKNKLKQNERRTNDGTRRAAIFPISSPASSLRELEEGYVSLLEKARELQQDRKILRHLEGMRPFDCDEHVSDLAALAQGEFDRFGFVNNKPVANAKQVAEEIVESTGAENGQEIFIKDLEDTARRLRISESGSEGSDNSDKIRDILLKRMKAIQGRLPKDLQGLAKTAFMHVEHELLRRNYFNHETMLGDAVSDIPRRDFWASEDGYAWDMNELAQAIKSGAGVMRNPLSKEMFTVADIKEILQHPRGKSLATLQAKQVRLKRGVRSKTRAELANLAKTLVEDMSDNQVPSRRAVDMFAGYVATLPDAEQRAIDELKVPAKDSHTNTEFDSTIGDAIRDAKMNRLCFHKAGDFLQQAAEYLR